ncbi:hypothetical protein NMG60_11023275 [Bertholletia excelsa]
MKGGRKKTAAADVVGRPLLSPLAEGGAAYAGDDGAAATEVEALEGQGQQQQQQQQQGLQGENEEEDEGFENFQVEDGDAEAGRVKLAEGFYEIEAVRKKRVRKGEAQYLIKWRGWPETANTWEPIENLLSCSDVVDAFEESLRSGKRRSSRRRKRKYRGTHSQPKKKQQTSPAAATYNVPAVKVRIIEEPSTVAPLDDLSFGKVGGVNDAKLLKQAKENGFGSILTAAGEANDQNELNLKISELRGTIATGVENIDKCAWFYQDPCASKGDVLGSGLSKVDGVEQVQSGRRTGAKRRKSGSVKRFKQDSVPCVVNDMHNATGKTTNGPYSRVGWQGSPEPDSAGNILGHKNKFDSRKNIPAIIDIIKPVSYSPSEINNAQDVSVNFMAMRSDGKEVVVDNKFLKANNPLLLINFYERHLRYSPTP